MANGRLVGLVLTVAALSGSALVGQGQPDPTSPRMQAAMAVQALFGSTGPESLQAFLEERLAPVVRKEAGDESLRQRLAELRSRYTGATPGGMMRTGEFAVRMMFGGPQGPLDPLDFELEAVPPHRFVHLGPIGRPSAGPSRGGPDAAGPAPLSTFDELERHLTAETAAGRFSGVVLVARGAEVRFHEAYGAADRQARTPNTPDTRFNLGSINKLFTAIAVYQLADRGAIDLTAPIGKYLPQFPEPARSQVTIQHLLDHRSGWGAYWDHPTWLEQRHTLKTVAGYMAFIKDIPLAFEPGSRQQYSNVGYEVLGAIVEAASGQSYYDYMRARVYEPAGMRDTDAFELHVDVANRAVGYVGPGLDATNTDMLAAKGTPAGGGYSTAPDLLRFVQALRAGRLVSAQHAARYEGRGVGGGAPGVNATLEMGVAGGHTVIVLANMSPPAAERVASDIARMLAAGRP